MVAVGPTSVPDLGMASALAPARETTSRRHLSYVVFDCLHVNGHKRFNRPLEERQEVLHAIRPALDGDHIRVTDAYSGATGTFVAQECRRLGFEGVVAKKFSSGYRPGKRTPDWVETPFRRRDEFAIGGYLSSRQIA